MGKVLMSTRNAFAAFGLLAGSLAVLNGCASPKPGDDQSISDGGRDEPDGRMLDAQTADARASGEPAQWTAIGTNTDAVLTAVHFFDDSEGWIAGEGATLQHTFDRGGKWDVVPPLGIDPDDSFVALHFLDDQTGWAAGSNMVVRSLDFGNSWHGWDTTGHPAGTPLFNAIFALSKTTVWTVGGVQNHPNVPSCDSVGTSCTTLWHDSLPVVRSQGRKTQQHLMDRANVLNDVYFASAATGYAVGTGGYILRIDEASTGVTIALQNQDSGTDVSLNAVFMLDEQNAWVVGDDGVILQTQDGEEWVARSSRLNVDLRDVFFVDADNGWIAGALGTILRTTDGGEHWTKTTTGTTAELNALSFPLPDFGVAVGEDGTALVWREP
jgi:photosystem II stability/assembly factor-like uncharacterized protein